MIATCLALSLAAAPADASVPYKLAIAAVAYVNVDAKTGGLYVDYFAQQVALHPGMSVLTTAEMSGLLGLERQKQLLGCASESCSVELAGALGVDALITGSLARAGGGYVINLKITRANDGAPVAVFSTRVATEDELFEYLKQTAAQLADKVRPGSGAPISEARAPLENGASTPMLPWVSAAVLAVGGLGSGAGLLVVSSSEGTALNGGDPSLGTFTQVSAARYAGQTHQALGLSLLAAGGAAAVSAAALALLPRESLLRKLAPGILGLAGVIAGGVLFGLAASDGSEIDSGDARIHNLLELDNVRAHGEASQTAGVVLVSAGALGVAASLLLLFVEGDTQAVALSPVRGGATLSFAF